MHRPLVNCRPIRDFSLLEYIFYAIFIHSHSVIIS